MDDLHIFDPDDDHVALLAPIIMPDFELSQIDSNGLPILPIGDEEDNSSTGEAPGSKMFEDTGRTAADVIATVVAEEVALGHVDPDDDAELLHAVEVMESQQPKTARSPKVDEEGKDAIIEDCNSKTTKKQTKYGLTIFRQWLTEREKDVNFENLDINKLDETLREFYAEVRNSNGELYSKSTFVGIRASINRHLRAPPHNKSFSLMNNVEFHKSNQMFTAMLKKLQREGLDIAKHHPSISEGDLKKLRESGVLSIKTPRGLQRKVWFDIMLSFGRRGRENQRNFTNETFAVKKDDCGFEYVEMIVSETTKNHRGGISDNIMETNPRMYETKKDDCPVHSFKKYMLKRNPESVHFFQLSRPKVNEGDDIWYTSRPLSIKILGTMMTDISKLANLSQSYTNHCVRATTINLLAHAGVSDREIMKITGHKSETSLNSYHVDSSENQKRKYSALLQGSSSDFEYRPSSCPPATRSTIEGSKYQAISPFPVSHPTTSVSLSVPHVPVPAPPSSVHFNGFARNTSVNVRAPTFQKQFEIHNSTVQVFNYHMPL